MTDDDDRQPGRPNPWIRGMVFVSSAFLFAGFLRASVAHPAVGVSGGVLFGLFWAWRRWNQARLVRMLRRGDLTEVLSYWSSSFERVPHAETMAPLLTATAFAAYGRVDDARRVLGSAARGPAWEAAIEHRLFLDALLTTFEGDVERALRISLDLSALPPPADATLRAKVVSLREAIAALVRAFDHRAAPGDLERLVVASEQSPLIHWAMRYGAAIVAVDAGLPDRARTLLEGAPRWPEESAFRSFHAELEGVLGPGASTRTDVV